jgi:hypothetical protein
MIVRMKWPVAFVALALTMTTSPLGARESKHIHEEVDPYTGLRTLTLDVDTRGCPDDSAPGSTSTRVKLLITATELGAHDVVYTLTTDLAYGRVIHPGKNGSMDTLVDGLAGQLFPVDAKTKWSERNAFSHHRHMRETIPFGLSLPYLDTLAEAKMFQFRINGQDHFVQRCATGRDLHNLREFLDAAAVY